MPSSACKLGKNPRYNSVYADGIQTPMIGNVLELWTKLCCSSRLTVQKVIYIRRCWQFKNYAAVPFLQLLSLLLQSSFPKKRRECLWWHACLPFRKVCACVRARARKCVSLQTGRTGRPWLRLPMPQVVRPRTQEVDRTRGRQIPDDDNERRGEGVKMLLRSCRHFSMPREKGGKMPVITTYYYYHVCYEGRWRPGCY